MATCPECDAEIEIDEDDLEEMEVGDPWNCDACGSSLRVATLVPLEFDGDDRLIAMEIWGATTSLPKSFLEMAARETRPKPIRPK